MDIKTILENQRKFFATHATKDINFRITQLKKLRAAILASQDKISAALYQDLHRSPAQAYLSEIGICLQEAANIIKNLKSWARPRNAKWPVIFPFSKSYVQYEPFGVALIISPWNYPFFLTLLPLMGAIAAGNCVAVKPSRKSPASLRALDELLSGCFGGEYIKVVRLEPGEKVEILKEKFDYILFTGGADTGKEVLRAAAEHITPVTLELGGKCPCIVDADIDLEKTAKRIVFGKYLNAGQTCVAPDYLLVNKKVKAALLDRMKLEIGKVYQDDPQKSADYGRIIDAEQFDKVAVNIRDGKVITGGEMDKNDRYIAPTIIEGAAMDSRAMREEIFGPIMPVVEFDRIEEAIEFVNKREKPLVLYLFSRNKKTQEKVLHETSSGSACINDVVIHLTSMELPFGGAGGSGFGRYRGKYGFLAFSNLKSVMKQTNLFDLSPRYPPVTPGKLKLFKLFLK
jgi:aldehyde dehydrogenase (NAD+)